MTQSKPYVAQMGAMSKSAVRPSTVNEQWHLQFLGSSVFEEAIEPFGLGLSNIMSYASGHQLLRSTLFGSKTDLRILHRIH